MERRVGDVPPLVVLDVREVRHLRHVALQARVVLGRHSRHGEAQRLRFERHADDREFLEILRCQAGDANAPVGFRLDQPLGLQHPKRLTQRRAAHAQVIRQRDLRHVRPSGDLAVEDRPPHDRVDVLGALARWDRLPYLLLHAALRAEYTRALYASARRLLFGVRRTTRQVPCVHVRTSWPLAAAAALPMRSWWVRAIAYVTQLPQVTTTTHGAPTRRPSRRPTESRSTGLMARVCGLEWRGEACSVVGSVRDGPSWLVWLVVHLWDLVGIRTACTSSSTGRSASSPADAAHASSLHPRSPKSPNAAEPSTAPTHTPLGDLRYHLPEPTGDSPRIKATTSRARACEPSQTGRGSRLVRQPKRPTTSLLSTLSRVDPGAPEMSLRVHSSHKPPGPGNQETAYLQAVLESPPSDSNR